MIDRKAWVTRHAPLLLSPDPASPLSVGNGHLVFTADVTGLQSFLPHHLPATPLCTLADWGWHTTPAPVPGGRYQPEDVREEPFDFCGRTVRYARTRYPGNEAVYDWLRENPHKASLLCAGFRLKGNDLAPTDVSGVRQQLSLYTGTLESRWTLHGLPVRVKTACDPEQDALAFRIESPLLAAGLTVDLDFPYGDPGIAAARWDAPDHHRTTLTENLILRQMDDLHYQLRVHAPGAQVTQLGPHRVRIAASGEAAEVCLALAREMPVAVDAGAVFARCEAWWAAFWQRGGAIDLASAADPRARELERRIVLSLYQLTINSAGCMPPAETGLVCNSWYGKAHLEMHPWHMAWAPLWGHGELLERSLPWYHDHLPQAQANARRNGYRGARWPKMVGPEAIDSPSPIATLLIWQQPHLLALLTLLLKTKKAEAAPSFLRTHWPLVRETADFMADFAVKAADGLYHLEPPLIPVQERFSPETVRDPAFEAAYWRFGLSLALSWADQLGETPDPLWRAVRDGMAPPPQADGLYIAHQNAPETFHDFLDDHPSMLQCLGLLPGRDVDFGRNINAAAMARTLDTVLERWDMTSLWGWDFAVMALTCLRLGDPGRALGLLMHPAEKNTYVASGHNRQADRRDLPLYLPGNGSLLLAAALMAEEGAFRSAGWEVRWEGLGVSPQG